MLDVVQTQNNAIFANAADWSAAKVLAIIALALGILALAASVFLLWKHKVFREQPDAAGEGVIKSRASAITSVVFQVFLCVMLLPLIMANMFLFDDYALSPYIMLMPYIVLFNTYVGITDRLEYDESGIRQYLAFRKVRSIQWNDLENVVYKRFGRLLILSGGGAKVTVELRNPNAPRLLEYMAERVTGEMRDTVEKQLPRKPDGKSV